MGVTVQNVGTLNAAELAIIREALREEIVFERGAALAGGPEHTWSDEAVRRIHALDSVLVKLLNVDSATLEGISE